ncbi:MAG: hypothetical protein FRX49_13507 [Trebouxia sp. A1-2]|nr:MAG: hypothetical protein FRX49_13507 [Trebouxia sp. A1-2]
MKSQTGRGKCPGFSDNSDGKENKKRVKRSNTAKLCVVQECNSVLTAMTAVSGNTATRLQNMRPLKDYHHHEKQKIRCQSVCKPKPYVHIMHRHIAAMLFNDASDGRSRGGKEGQGVAVLSPISKHQDSAGFHSIKLKRGHHVLQFTSERFVVKAPGHKWAEEEEERGWKKGRKQACHIFSCQPQNQIKSEITDCVTVLQCHLEVDLLHT